MASKLEDFCRSGEGEMRIGEVGMRRESRERRGGSLGWGKNEKKKWKLIYPYEMASF